MVDTFLPFTIYYITSYGKNGKLFVIIIHLFFPITCLPIGYETNGNYLGGNPIHANTSVSHTL